MTRLLSSLFCLSLVACTQFPDLDETQTQELIRADYPALVPIDPILAAQTPSTLDVSAENDRLNARLANLRRRADRIRGAVLAGAERQRLENGLQ